MGSLLREFQYGWMVVVGRFISGFVEVGTVKSFGVLLPDIVTQLNTSSAKIGLAFGLCHGLTFGLGPLTSALYRRTQSRMVMVLGTLVAILSITMSSFATDGNGLLFTLMFTGLGYSLMCLPTLMAINKHFVDHFTLAYGVAQTGPAIGMIILPVITENLNHSFGWRGALFLLGAINFLMMITAIITKEPKHVDSQCERKKSDDSDDIEGNRAQIEDACINLLDIKPLGASTVPNGATEKIVCQEHAVNENGSPLNLPKDVSKKASKNFFLMKKFKSDDELSKPQHLAYRSHAETEQNLCNKSVKCKTHQKRDKKAAYFNDKQLLCSDSLSDFGNGQWAFNVSEKFDPVESHGRQSGRDSHTLECCCKYFLSSCNSVVMFFVRFLDLELVRDMPAFSILLLSIILMTGVHAAWMIFLVPQGVAKGIPLEKAVLLSSVGGVGNLIGRIFQGPIVETRLLTGVQLSILLSILNAITFGIDPLLKSLPVLCVDAFFSGVCSGALVPLVTISVKEQVPRDRFANAAGLMSFCYGLGEPLGGFLAGKLFDVTSSYEKIFLVFTGVEIFKALLLTVVAIMVWRGSTSSHR